MNDTKLQNLKIEMNKYGIEFKIHDDKNIIINKKTIEIFIANNELFINNIHKLSNDNLSLLSVYLTKNNLTKIVDLNLLNTKLEIILTTNNYLLSKTKAEVYIKDYYIFFMTPEQAELLKIMKNSEGTSSYEEEFKNKEEIYHPKIKKGLKVCDVYFNFNGNIEKINLDFEDDSLYIKGLEFLNIDENHKSLKLVEYGNENSKSSQLILNYSKNGDDIQFDVFQKSSKNIDSSIDSINIKNHLEVKENINLNSNTTVNLISILPFMATIDKFNFDIKVTSLNKDRINTLIKAYSRDDTEEYRDTLNYSLYKVLNDGFDIKLKLSFLNLIQNTTNYEDGEIIINMSLLKNKLNIEDTFSNVLKYIDIEFDIDTSIKSLNYIQGMIENSPSDSQAGRWKNKYNDYLSRDSQKSIFNKNKISIRIQNSKLYFNKEFIDTLSVHEKYSGYFFDKNKFDEKYIYVFCEDGIFDDIAVFSIESGKILDGNLRTKHSEKFVKKWIKSHNSYLNKQWSLISDNDKPQSFILE